MCEEEILACAFDRWYDQFRDLTFRSRAIPLPEEFVQYLLSDGILVPGCSAAGGGGHDSDDTDSEWGDGGSDSSAGGAIGEMPPLPEFESAVVEAIEELGGAALPKLNWSAPKDAKWVLTGRSLRCETAADVFILLKASDFIMHDLCHSFDSCGGQPGGDESSGGCVRQRPDTFMLVLRRWYDINEAGEFRCFVCHGRLCGVSQRHTSMHFQHLSDLVFVEEMRQHLTSWFDKHVRGRFPLERYAFDVYVGKPPRQKVTLVDFSPWGPSTDPLLFDWDELGKELEGRRVAAADELSDFELRVVRGEGERRGKLENYHAVPLEIAELGCSSPEELEGLFRRAEAAMPAESP